jgi:hypothetical protein
MEEATDDGAQITRIILTGITIATTATENSTTSMTMTFMKVNSGGATRAMKETTGGILTTAHGSGNPEMMPGTFPSGQEIESECAGMSGGTLMMEIVIPIKPPGIITMLLMREGKIMAGVMTRTGIKEVGMKTGMMARMKTTGTTGTGSMTGITTAVTNRTQTGAGIMILTDKTTTAKAHTQTVILTTCTTRNVTVP